MVTPILDGAQGSDDDIAWGLARFFWVSQLLIRFGLLTGTAATAFIWMVAAVPPSLVPSYFDLAVIGSVSIYQVAWWDETHKKPVLGGKGHDTAGSRTQVRYRYAAH